MTRYLLTAALLALALTAHATDCTTNPGKPVVLLGKSCGPQTGPCEPATVCEDHSGCHCTIAGGTVTTTTRATPTTHVTTTLGSGTTVPGVTTTRVASTTVPSVTTTTAPAACAQHGNQCNEKAGNRILVCCDAGDDCLPIAGSTTMTKCQAQGGTVTTTTQPGGVVTTTTVPSTTAARLTDPCRTDYRRISAKRKLSDIYIFDTNGRLMTQKGRSCVQDMMIFQAIPETALLLRGVPHCRTKLPDMVVGDVNAGKLNAQTTRLQVRSPYREPAVTKVWEIGLSGPGRAYGFEGDIIEDAAACLADNPVECATVFQPQNLAAVFGIVTGPGAVGAPIQYTRPDLLDLYDLRIENGQCLKGASFPLPVMTEPMDNRVGQMAPLVGALRFPATDLDLLDAADAAHRCGAMGGTGCPSVKAAQERYVAAAHTEQERYFREMRPFIGGCDPYMPAAECAQWHRLEHFFYACWAQKHREGATWGEAETECATPHLFTHLCSKMGMDPNLLVLMPCGDNPKTGAPYKMSECVNVWRDRGTPLTCAGYLHSAVAQAILLSPM